MLRKKKATEKKRYCGGVIQQVAKKPVPPPVVCPFLSSCTVSRCYQTSIQGNKRRRLFLSSSSSCLWSVATFLPFGQIRIINTVERSPFSGDLCLKGFMRTWIIQSGNGGGVMVGLNAGGVGMIKLGFENRMIDRHLDVLGTNCIFSAASSIIIRVEKCTYL